MRIAAQAYLASKPECQINKRCKAFCIDGLIPPCENNLELIRVYSIVEVARCDLFSRLLQCYLCLPELPPRHFNKLQGISTSCKVFQQVVSYWSIGYVEFSLIVWRCVVPGRAALMSMQCC